jgi:DNA ligase (NAD+)
MFMQVTSLQKLPLTSEAVIEQELRALNHSYRDGNPLVSDFEYDQRRSILIEINPKNTFVNSVEPEMERDAKGNVAHTSPMLSTDKAYNFTAVEKWLKKVIEYSKENGFGSDPLIRITPKLDGCAARYIPNSSVAFITRGSGWFGTDISRSAERFVFVGDKHTTSVGEIVCDETYFQTQLKPQGVIHPRSFVAGLISADTISNIGEKALQDGAVHFVTYNNMKGLMTLKSSELLDMKEELEFLEIELMSECDYRTDGVVIQIDDNTMFRDMGNNSQFHYAQLAKKIAGEATDAVIIDVIGSVGRTGRITPVLSIEPTMIGGVIVSNVTAHHYGNVKKLSLGAGGVVSCIRSGEVIPKIQSVRVPANSVIVPSHCPVCATSTVMEGDFLKCPNDQCKGRIASALQYFTKTLNMDLIGSKAAEKLAENGFGCIELLSIDAPQLTAMGFGEGQAKNILLELERIKNFPMDDYKLLASVGISKLGNRASKSLLKEHPLEVLQNVTFDNLVSIEGFGDKKAKTFLEGIIDNIDLISALSNFFGSITPSKRQVADMSSAIAGKNIVFTGKMVTSDRATLSKQAEELGATVQSGVSSKTNFLIIGEKVGSSKIEKAKKFGTQVLTETEYNKLINDSSFNPITSS